MSRRSSRLAALRTSREAENNSRRNMAIIVRELESDLRRTTEVAAQGDTLAITFNSELRRAREASPTRNQHRRIGSDQIGLSYDELLTNLEGSSNPMIVDHTPPPPPSPQIVHIEPTFTCPICFGQLVNTTATKCGHVFCKECIRAALAAQRKCPICRKRCFLKDTIRIYLPATN